MAMRSRPTRPQQPVRTQFQTLRPEADWREEEEATILLVYLPGFLKEQIRTTYDEPQRSIRLQGERRLPNNRRLRVDERYSVPENCEGSKMGTQLGRGILMVTLPKTKPAPEPEPETPKLEETTDDLTTQKGGEESVSASPGNSLFQTAGEETSSKTTLSTKETEQAVSTSDSKMQIDEEKVRQESGEKKERGQREKPQRIIESVQGKEGGSKESAIPEIIVSKVQEKDKEMITEISGKDSEDARGKKIGVSKAEEKKKEKITKISGNDSGDAKVKEIVSRAEEKEKGAEKSSNDSGDAAASAKIGPVMEPRKQGNPLANTVVAALVILGLGAYYFYSFAK